MTLRDLLVELLDAGTDNLDTEILFYSEEPDEEFGNYAIEHNKIDVSINGKCIQLFMHD